MLGQRQSHPARVDGDPAPAPLLGNVSGRAATTGRIQNHVAGIRSHQETTLHDSSVQSGQYRSFLHPVDSATNRVSPYVGERCNGINRKGVAYRRVSSVVSANEASQHVSNLVMP